ncbi:MAG: hypothetical protein HY826_09690 [Actinobacteria bacterium]|nr:hypothetical protein [Actinomycetota bacterium]
MTWVYVLIAVVLVVSVWLMRGRRVESGMTSYRKHIDALSSESRRGVREVNDRQRNGRRPNDTGK